MRNNATISQRDLRFCCATKLRASASCVLLLLCDLVPLSQDLHAAERFVVATKSVFSGGLSWSSLTTHAVESEGELGDERGRPFLRVLNGDTISFVAGPGCTQVVFENGKDELRSGVWEIVQGSGKLESLPAGPASDELGPDALISEAKAPGATMISIRLKRLAIGASEGILFAGKTDGDGSDLTSNFELGVLLIDPTSPSDACRPTTANDQTAAALFSPYEHAWRLFIDTNRISPDTGETEWLSWMRTRTLFDNPNEAPRWGQLPASELLKDPFLDNKRVNRAAFDYIVANDLYNTDGQLAFLETARSFARPGYGKPQVVSDPKVIFPIGSRTLRVRWGSIKEEEKRNYISTYYPGRDDGSFAGWYGLKAMHIASKDLPNWFWCTFQHDSVTESDPLRWRAPKFEGDGEDGWPGAAPLSFHMDGTVFENYSLMGFQSSFSDSTGLATRVHNLEFEPAITASSSCITCHSRAVIGGDPKAGTAQRLGQFETRLPDTGAVGAPKPEWFYDPETGEVIFAQLDFFFSFRDARSKTNSELNASGEIQNEMSFHGEGRAEGEFRGVRPSAAR